MSAELSKEICTTAEQLVRDGSVGIRKCFGQEAQIEMLRAILFFAADDLSKIVGDVKAAEAGYQLADEIATRGME